MGGGGGRGVAGWGGERERARFHPLKRFTLGMQQTKFTNLCQSQPTVARAAGHTQWENQPWIIKN